QNNTYIWRPPIAKVAYNHLPLSTKNTWILLRKSFRGTESSSCSGTYNKKITKISETTLNAGIDNSGVYHVINAKADPTIGLKTLPTVFEVSTIPRPVLTSLSSLYMSPMRGRTTGNVPEAPMP